MEIDSDGHTSGDLCVLGTLQTTLQLSSLAVLD